MQGSDGYFYGTTAYGGTNDLGTVFKIRADGALTSLYSFTGTNDGAYPQAALAQGSDGNFYGTTASGGAYTNQLGQGCGTIFKISTNGTLTSLYSFSGGNDGGYPQAALVQGSDGYFYGTTASGGGYEMSQPGICAQCGTVFKITTNGVLTSLYSFGGGSDGAYPYAGLVQSSNGRFYGTTAGGLGGVGTVFRLTVAPALQAMTLTGSTLGLTSGTEAGGTYQWQYTSDLTSSNWINLGNPATATEAVLGTTDSITNSPQRFYRLVLSP
ncbi:MAG: choice-of-anchor tandem repeat GloVer-containing protein [Verrucomicrobiota bacterium]